MTDFDVISAIGVALVSSYLTLYIAEEIKPKFSWVTVLFRVNKEDDLSSVEGEEGIVEEESSELNEYELAV